MKPTYGKTWARSLLMRSDMTFGPSFKSNEDSQTLSAYNSLIIGPRGLQCESNLKEIMG